jgi:hypothetical protein
VCYVNVTIICTTRRGKRCYCNRIRYRGKYCCDYSSRYYRKYGSRLVVKFQKNRRGSHFFVTALSAYYFHHGSGPGGLFGGNGSFSWNGTKQITPGSSLQGSALVLFTIAYGSVRITGCALVKKGLVCLVSFTNLGCVCVRIPDMSKATITVVTEAASTITM